MRCDPYACRHYCHSDDANEEYADAQNEQRVSGAQMAVREERGGKKHESGGSEHAKR